MSIVTDPQRQDLALKGRVMIEESSDAKMIGLFKQHLKSLREGREVILAHITASQEMIEQSRSLIVQIDEQIDRMERELGWGGGRS